ncbi:MAG: FG-GAP repeat protein [Nitrospirae bacterium]|nr:FG-GAP repeat protein [Nitrospirota bacterium]
MRNMANARVVLFAFFILNLLCISEATAAFITDVNGDGWDDMIVGAYGADPSGRSSAGSAYVYSGAAGMPGVRLYTFNGAVTGDSLGYSVAMAGDVNGDGKGDLIVGAPYADPGGRVDAGSVFVYSGATGALLYRFDGPASNDHFGFYVAAGDANGDGKSDIVVTNGLCNSTGSVYVFSGATGAQLYRFTPPSGESFCRSVAVADVNGDGKADIIVGNDCGSCGTYDIIVYSGATGAMLYGINNGSSGIYSVSAGDFNCDGKADIIAGAPYTTGTVYIYNGATGALIRTHSGGAANDYFGWSVSSAGNLDGLNCSDYIIGAPYADPNGNTNAGSAYIYNGYTGSQIARFDGAASGDAFGWSVSGAGMIKANSPPVPGVIIGAPEASPGGRIAAGSAYAYVYYNSRWYNDTYYGDAAGDYFGYSVSGKK